MAEASTEREFRHIPALDGVRGVAVILVVAFHYLKLWRVDVGGLLPAGYIGVDVFFVLSGFLITSLLVGERAKTGRVSFARFYARRALRLLPALFTFLIAHAVYAHVKHVSMGEELKQVASVVAYVSNFAQTYWLPRMLQSGLSFTWSLAIEEQFYLLWPALLLFVILRYARSRAAILAVLIGLAALSALVRIYLWHWGGGFPAAYMRPDARADGLLLGAACAFLWRWRWVPTKWLNEVATVAFAGIIGTALVVPRQSTVLFWGGFTVVSGAAAVIILAVSENEWSLQPLMEWAPLRTVGRVSYGLYLWHALSLRIAASFLQGRGAPVVATVGIVLTAAFTATSWVLIEQPFLRLKDRLFRSPAKPADPVVAVAGTSDPPVAAPARTRTRR